MSTIKNSGLDQYDKVQSLNGIGGKRAKHHSIVSIALSVHIGKPYLGRALIANSSAVCDA